ncbi:hypothetical protein M501DRAFT_1013684 [Patellaria atrata CBS 101060]|uniref:UBL3-like ubiquitin domain-containing protein n=1 Tax=Patellaria atrata CBS 101060 TaxID=1346257 RepID=A0A9P4SGZ9_9PEZI|nr:hypothetical protein M501DRAFT_1013684 [Patellaria atrata CBS 101060]
MALTSTPPPADASMNHQAETPHSTTDNRSPTPIEMANLPAQSSQSSTGEPQLTSTSPPLSVQQRLEQTTSSLPENSQSQPSETVDVPATSSAEDASLTRNDSGAIGPSTDAPMSQPDPAGGPALMITLLLTSGARHPYKIDEKYLKKRGVNVEEMDPRNLSVYQLKELIWRDWREEWEPRPTAPNFIRLISFGRMLGDADPLKNYKFNAEAPNVLHMTVKPQDLIEEEDTKTGKSTARDRGDNEPTAGCRCVIL